MDIRRSKRSTASPHSAVLGRFAGGHLVLLTIALTACADSGDTEGATGVSQRQFTAGEAAVSVYSFMPPADGVAIAAGYRLAPIESFCTTEVIGDCTIYECTESDPGGQPVMTGRVSVTVDGRSVSIDPIGSGVYAEDDSAAPELFRGGETVVFEVDPSVDVPFHTGSVIAPYPVVLTTPSGNSIAIDRTKDLAFAWSGGRTGDVLFVVAVQRPDGSLVSESCRFPASAGAASVPSATLARLPASNGSPTLSYLGVISRTEIDAGAWHPAFSALVEVLAPDGTPMNPEVIVR